jgi:hypothetical protein
MIGEERPIGDNWHADLIKRVATERRSRRPAILSVSALLKLRTKRADFATGRLTIMKDSKSRKLFRRSTLL